MKHSIESTYKHHGRPLGWGSGPEADWKVMFSIFLATFLVSMALFAFLFNRARTGDLDFGSGAVSPIDKDLLHSTAIHYEDRKIEFESARTTPETAPDPSL